MGMMGFFYGGMMGFVEGGGGVPPAPMGALWGDRGSHRTPYTAGGGHCAQPLHATLLATKIEDICRTSRVVTDYTGVLLYSNTGSFINALFSFFFLLLKSFHSFFPHLQLAKLF